MLKDPAGIEEVDLLHSADINDLKDFNEDAFVTQLQIEFDQHLEKVKDQFSTSIDSIKRGYASEISQLAKLKLKVA